MARQRNPLPIPEMTCPLGDEDCNILDRALKSCNDTTCMTQKLAALGLNLEEQQAAIDYHQRIAQGLKAIYFPDRQ